MATSDYLHGSQVVIIGAGVVGAAVTYRLTQAGAQVTTVERRFPGCGTSGKTFGWLNSFEKPPRHYHRLNYMSILDHQELAQELNGRWLAVDGGLHWEHDADQARVKTLRDRVRQLREWGVRVDRTTPEIAMRELEPDLWIDPGKVTEVYFVPREGVLDPVAMAHGVLHPAMMRYGAKLVTGSVTELRGPKGAVSTVILQDGTELAADVVINAAGPDADRIALLVGVKLPLAPTIGLTVTTAPAPICLRRVIHAPEAILRPEGADRLIVRHREVDSQLPAGEVVPVDSAIVNEVMERVRRIVPAMAEIPAETVRIGTRPMPQDGVSIVGFDPAVAGFYSVVTHSGVTLSARLALLITEELAGGNPEGLEPYRPSRFLKNGAQGE